jgi:hypothetical protein
MTTLQEQTPPEYCYSTDEEIYSYESLGDVIDEIKCNTDTPIGASYWRGEKKELTHAACIDVGSFLEQCDERAYEEIGEIYNNCFTDVGDDAKNELGDLILEWAKKHVNIQYWKVINSQELKIAAEDLE